MPASSLLNSLDYEIELRMFVVDLVEATSVALSDI